MEYKLYRLRCSFDVDWDMPFEEVQKVSRIAGEKFIRDMGKQGFRLTDGRLYLDPKPRIHWEPVELPTVAAINGLKEKVVGTIVQDANRENGKVDYRMWGVFAHKEIPTQRKEGV